MSNGSKKCLKMATFLMTMTMLIGFLTATTNATCGSCNERIKLSIICCIFDGRCCLLGPVAVGKRDLEWVQQRYKERKEDSILEDFTKPVHIVHPLARPRD